MSIVATRKMKSPESCIKSKEATSQVMLQIYAQVGKLSNVFGSMDRFVWYIRIISAQLS